MKHLMLVLLGFFLSGFPAAAQTPTQIIHLAERLRQVGIDEFVVGVRQNHIVAPRIPSPWHIENVSSDELKPLDEAARKFGEELARQLDGEAESIRTAKADEQLYHKVQHLVALTTWCTETVGYGNIFLAQRALDLASVGAARLASNLDFSGDEIEELVRKFPPSWSVDSRRRILNEDAGVLLFPAGDQRDLEQTWLSGKILLAESKDPAQKALRTTYSPGFRLRETQEIRDHLSFFNTAPVRPIGSSTLVDRWNENRHSLIVAGLDLQSTHRLMTLLEFRRVVGRFPEKPTFTQAEMEATKRAIAEGQKKGVKIVSYESAFSSPGEAAFFQAWDEAVKAAPEVLAREYALHRNLAATAWATYDAVRRNELCDEDTGVRSK